MWRCKGCNTQNWDSAETCNKCGAASPVAQAGGATLTPEDKLFAKLNQAISARYAWQVNHCSDTCRAIEELAKIKTPEAVALLTRVLEETGRFPKTQFMQAHSGSEAAIKSLTAIGGDSACRALRSSLRHPYPHVRCLAAKGLGSLADSLSAFEIVLSAIERESTYGRNIGGYSVMAPVLQSLGKSAYADAIEAKDLGRLARAVLSENCENRRRFLDAVINHGVNATAFEGEVIMIDDSVIDALTVLSEDDDAEVRDKARMELPKAISTRDNIPGASRILAERRQTNQ